MHDLRNAALVKVAKLGFQDRLVIQGHCDEPPAASLAPSVHYDSRATSRACPAATPPKSIRRPFIASALEQSTATCTSRPTGSQRLSPARTRETSATLAAGAGVEARWTHPYPEVGSRDRLRRALRQICELRSAVCRT